MKTTIALTLALTTATAFANNHQKVLQQVDALVAGDTYEQAFACGDSSTSLDQSCWDNECGVTYISSEVTTCGKITTITSYGDSDDDEASVSQIDKSLYNKLKGNPLRFFEISEEKLKNGGVEWKSAKAFKLNHLGASRKALKVSGIAEVCFEEGEVEPTNQKTDNCIKGPVEVVIVQGVPFLAKHPKLKFNVDGLSIEQNLIEFSRKK